MVQRRLEKIKLEVRVIKDIKKNDKEDIKELSLDQFTTMLQNLKVEKKEYRGFTGDDYCLILRPGNYRNVFMEDFSESL